MGAKPPEKNCYCDIYQKRTSLNMGGGVNIDEKKVKYLLKVRCRAKKIVNILFEDHQKKILEKEGGGSWKGGGSWN